MSFNYGIQLFLHIKSTTMKNIQRLFIALLFTIFTVIHANAQITISVRIGPPPLPFYEQPYCPGDGYLWIPGYWAYGDDGYYWVPGYWALPPEIGFYWTPGYWGYTDAYYRWHRGYWGRTVGYYGGIDYGYGYGGHGYYGGEWLGRTFRYNTAVTRVNTTVVHNTYVNRTVVNNNTIVNNKRASFNGRGGVSVKPTRQEQIASMQNHLNPTTIQVSHQNTARADKRQFALVNKGHPARLVEEGTSNNNHAAAQKNKAIQNANANRTVTNSKANNTNRERVNQDVLKQQQVNAANERKQSIARQQHAQQVNANNESRKAIQNQQQHTQQMKEPRQEPEQRVTANRGDGKKDKH